MPSNDSSLLAYLRDLPPGRVLSGQVVSNYGGYDIEVQYEYNFEELYYATGEYPAIMGYLLGLDDTEVKRQAGLNLLAAHCDRGGIVEFSWVPANPFTGENWQDLTRPLDWIDLFTPGTDAYVRWQASIAEAAQFLLDLRSRSRGAPILWTPFGESNFNKSSWWCRGEIFTPGVIRDQIIADRVRIWRELHERLGGDYGLDDLGWVYSPSHLASEYGVGPLMLYPGDDVVDVVGLNMYSDPFEPYLPAWTDVMSLGKPVALTECGPSRADGQWDACKVLTILDVAPIKYFLFWASWTAHLKSIVDLRDPKGLMSDPRVVNLGSVGIGVNANVRGVFGTLRSGVCRIEESVADIVRALNELEEIWIRADSAVTRAGRDL